MAFVNPTCVSVVPRSQMAAVCANSVVVVPRAAKVASISMSVGYSSLTKTGLEQISDQVRAYEPFRTNTQRARPTFEGEFDEILVAAYRQIFGNAHIMASQRATLASIESEFRDGRMTVKEFCRMLCKSQLYKEKFFNVGPVHTSIEKMFKHVLGRTPEGLLQYRKRFNLFEAEGYDAMVDSFFDDGEYDEFYGDYTVPFYRGFRTTAGKPMAPLVVKYFESTAGDCTTEDLSKPRNLMNEVAYDYFGKRPKVIRYLGKTTPIAGSISTVVGSMKGGVSGADAAPCIMGIPADANGPTFRITVIGYNKGPTCKITGKPKMRRSNKTYIVGRDEMFSLYNWVFKNGGKITSVTPL